MGGEPAQQHLRFHLRQNLIDFAVVNHGLPPFAAPIVGARRSRLSYQRFARSPALRA